MADPVIDNVFTGLLQAESQLRQKAEADAVAARLCLMRVAQNLAADWLEEMGKKGRTPDLLEIAEVVTVRAADLRATVDRCENFEKVQAMRRQLDNMNQKNIVITRERDAIRAQLDSLQRITLETTRKEKSGNNQTGNYQRQPPKQNQLKTISVARVQEPPPPPAWPAVKPHGEQDASSAEPQLPGWFVDWTEKRDKWEIEALRIVGAGVSPRKEIAQELTKLKGVSSTNTSTPSAALEKLKEAGFIEIEELPREGVGSLGHIVRLTDRGREAYEITFTQSAKQGEFDALRGISSSASHTLLILKASKHLRADGWCVQPQADQIKTNSGVNHKPDITASKNGTTYHFEVERHTNKSGRDPKWANVVEVNNGNVFVFCDNDAGMRAIQSEVNRSLSANLENTNLFVANVQLLERGEMGEAGSMWHKWVVRRPNLIDHITLAATQLVSCDLELPEIEIERTEF